LRCFIKHNGKYVGEKVLEPKVNGTVSKIEPITQNTRQNGTYVYYGKSNLRCYKKTYKIEPMVQTVAELPRTSFHSSSNIFNLKKYFLPLNGKCMGFSLHKTLFNMLTMFAIKQHIP
jgi:hypothetical protein